MKIKDLLAYTREMAPNVLPDSLLLAWINELEGRVMIDIYLMDPLEVKIYSLPEDEETQLLVPVPHTAMYRHWMKTMVALENGEYQKCQNLMEVFNSAWNEYACWFAETQGTDGDGVRRGFYLSAYGIAVKHGYAGTEEEWLESLKGEKGAPFVYEDFTEEQLQALKDGVVQDALDRANQAASSAEQSAAAADQAKTGAKNSLDQVIVYEQSVARAAANAKAAETNAGTHANAAAGYMSAAAGNAESAVRSAANAKSSEKSAEAAAGASQSAAQEAARSAAEAKNAAADAVLYTEQALTEEQKAQARANIGAASSESEGLIYIAEQEFYFEYGRLLVSTNGRPDVGDNVKVVWDGITYKQEVFEYYGAPYVGNASMIYGGGYNSGECFAIFFGEETDAELISADNKPIVVKVTELSEGLSFIPVPPTAAVGQTVIVKAVDENGKPTEWAAADAPYSKTEIDAIMGSYITDIDTLVGGDD